MLGAHEMGMKTAWLKDGSREWQQDFAPHLTIRHIRELT
jgi:FMN phosphatase YigB (HAD superfamily)